MGEPGPPRHQPIKRYIAALLPVLAAGACTFDPAALRGVDAQRDVTSEQLDGQGGGDQRDGPSEVVGDGSDTVPSDSPIEGMDAPPPPPAAGCPADPDLRACYTFDELAGASIKDGSGNAHDGTTDATRDVGRFGGGLHFATGKQRVVVPDAASLNLGTDGTLELWIKPSANPASAQLIVKSAPGFGPGSFLLARYGTGLLACTNPGASVCCGGGDVPIGEWTHVAATLTGGRMRVYADGNEVASCPSLGSFSTNTAPLTIGGPGVVPDAADYFFLGDLDVARVYGRARTAAEVCGDADREWTGSACM